MIGAASVSTATGEVPSSHISIATLIKSIDRAEPISKSWLDKNLMSALSCTQSSFPFGKRTSHRIDCDAYNVKVGNAVIEHIDFRSTDVTSILILNGIDNECVPLASVFIKSRSIDFEDGCTDGVHCPYISQKRRWGKISAPIPQGKANGSTCVSNLIFKSGL